MAASWTMPTMKVQWKGSMEDLSILNTSTVCGEEIYIIIVIRVELSCSRSCVMVADEI